MLTRQYLGIEIGGTKLQLGVGTGEQDRLVELVRASVDVARGAEGIVREIERIGHSLCERHAIESVGIGFGGPVDTQTGIVTKSHQITGWDGIPLAERLEKSFGRRILIDNDCNVAALGEATFGAGQGSGRVFYVTAGTGIGGGFVVNGRLDGNGRPAISEIGHLRPGADATSCEKTVEAISSGWGISNWTQKQLLAGLKDPVARAQLLRLCDGDVRSLTTKQIGIAATEGNAIALGAIDRATRTLGWAIAQVITLLAPDVVVVGGGVSLMGDVFFEPLRRHVGTYVFPPLAKSYSIDPAALGEEVVVHGAIQLVSTHGTTGRA